ncbi:MAG: DNA/RNA non-specific endonuclease [Crocinitomix sp.]|nr:DNA/RNA non-specific endonuclease [Crocinitomix sp.]
MKIIVALLMISSICYGQVDGPAFKKIDQQLDSIENLKQKLTGELELIRLKWIQDEITTIGTPLGKSTQEIVKHSAMRLSYNEAHEQANWVMHVILPAIMEGNVSRTNDFREDDLVKTGTAQEQDYFLKTLKADSTYKYDGFGYDRGHLAPSADFRWSSAALSESYYYSNMSPQVAEFNREKWASLENNLREYVITNETHLMVVTAPVLSADLTRIERSVNGLSIPKYYVKAVLDTKNNRAIAYLMPNEKLMKPIEAYAVSIDSAEIVLGYDLFPNMDDQIENEIEAKCDYQNWLSEREKGDVIAISRKRLPKNTLSTDGIQVFIGNEKKRTVCGKVVSTKKHEKGHVFINLDKKFPNQIFSVSIFDSNINNFDYQPEIYLMDKEVCFTGMITEHKGTPSMVIEHGKQVKLLVDLSK